MNIPKAYIGGFLKAVKLPRMLFLIYLSNLFTALLLALPFMGAVKNGFGHSSLTSDLVHDFNFTAIGNLMYYHGDGILAILGGIKWIVLAYFLLSIFLTGGIVGTYNKESYSNSHFFGSGAYNFFRFLGLNLISIVFQLIFALAVYVPLYMILKSKADLAETETPLYYLIIAGIGIHSILFLIISMINDYGKFYLVLSNSFNIFKGFWRGTKYVFGHFLKTFFLYVFMLFIPVAIMYIYLYFQPDLKMATGVGILIVFLVQQAFVLLRCFLRAWILGSQYQMYAHDYVLTDPVQGVIFKVFDQSGIKSANKKEQETTKVTAEKTGSPNQPTGYAIDFNSTFSAENEIDADNVISEQEMLDMMSEGDDTDLGPTSLNNSQGNVIGVSTIDDEAVLEDDTQKEHQDIDNEANNSITDPEKNTDIPEQSEVEVDEANDETEVNITDKSEVLDDSSIENKMIEMKNSNAGAENTSGSDQEQKNTEKTYTAGETVELTDENTIEQQMNEKNANDNKSDQFSDSEIEKKMLDKIENEGTIIDKNKNIKNTEIPKYRKNVAVLEINQVAENIVKKHNLQGVSEVADDIDGEAVLGDIDAESESEDIEMLEQYQEIDDDYHHQSYEVVEQNVLGKAIDLQKEVNDFKEKRKKDDDIDFGHL